MRLRIQKNNQSSLYYKKLIVWLLPLTIVITLMGRYSSVTSSKHNYDAELEDTRNKLKFEDNDLTAFNDNFFYKGGPVHPEIIERFLSFAISDGWKPKTVSMDIVACTDTNEFYKKFDWIHDKHTLMCHLDRESEGFFRYRWLGKLDNGLHVIKTIWDGGGTLQVQNLLFLKASKGTAFTPDGTPYYQLLLTFVRSYSLGDNRIDCDIQILHNRVIVKTKNIFTNDQGEFDISF